MFVYAKIWRALFSYNTRFEICPFAYCRRNSLWIFLWKRLKPTLTPNLVHSFKLNIN